MPKNKKELTPRQQVAKWIEESNLTASEEVITEIFDCTIKYKKEFKDMDLEQAFSAAFVTYINDYIAIHDEFPK